MLSHRVCKLFLLAVFILSFPAVVLADTVQGRVAAISSSALDLIVYDTQGRPYPNRLHLKVDSHTRANGVPSVAAFRKQDPVSANVRQEKAGVWHADSISLLQGAATVQPASVSSSLMDALKSPTGQKVIRGGLTGAITGAVASGASGGKAGKGALIGAGVGAVGGFLEGLFSQRSQSQNSSTTVTNQEDARR